MKLGGLELCSDCLLKRKFERIENTMGANQSNDIAPVSDLWEVWELNNNKNDFKKEWNSPNRTNNKQRQFLAPPPARSRSLPDLLARERITDSTESLYTDLSSKLQDESTIARRHSSPENFDFLSWSNAASKENDIDKESEPFSPDKLSHFESLESCDEKRDDESDIQSKPDENQSSPIISHATSSQLGSDLITYSLSSMISPVHSKPDLPYIFCEDIYHIRSDSDLRGKYQSRIRTRPPNDHFLSRSTSYLSQCELEEVVDYFPCKDDSHLSVTPKHQCYDWSLCIEPPCEYDKNHLTVSMKSKDEDHEDELAYSYICSDVEDLEGSFVCSDCGTTVPQITLNRSGDYSAERSFEEERELRNKDEFVLICVPERNNGVLKESFRDKGVNCGSLSVYSREDSARTRRLSGVHGSLENIEETDIEKDYEDVEKDNCSVDSFKYGISGGIDDVVCKDVEKDSASKQVYEAEDFNSVKKDNEWLEKVKKNEMNEINKELRKSNYETDVDIYCDNLELDHKRLKEITDKLSDADIAVVCQKDEKDCCGSKVAARAAHENVEEKTKQPDPMTKAFDSVLHQNGKIDCRQGQSAAKLHGQLELSPHYLDGNEANADDINSECACCKIESVCTSGEEDVVIYKNLKKAATAFEEEHKQVDSATLQAKIKNVGDGRYYNVISDDEAGPIIEQLIQSNLKRCKDEKYEENTENKMMTDVVILAGKNSNTKNAERCCRSRQYVDVDADLKDFAIERIVLSSDADNSDRNTIATAKCKLEGNAKVEDENEGLHKSEDESLDINTAKDRVMKESAIIDEIDKRKKISNKCKGVADNDTFNRPKICPFKDELIASEDKCAKYVIKKCNETIVEKINKTEVNQLESICPSLIDVQDVSDNSYKSQSVFNASEGLEEEMENAKIRCEVSKETYEIVTKEDVELFLPPLLIFDSEESLQFAAIFREMPKADLHKSILQNANIDLNKGATLTYDIEEKSVVVGKSLMENQKDNTIFFPSDKSEIVNIMPHDGADKHQSKKHENCIRQFSKSKKTSVSEGESYEASFRGCSCYSEDVSYGCLKCSHDKGTSQSISESLISADTGIDVDDASLTDWEEFNQCLDVGSSTGELCTCNRIRRMSSTPISRKISHDCSGRDVTNKDSSRGQEIQKDIENLHGSQSIVMNFRSCSSRTRLNEIREKSAGSNHLKHDFDMPAKSEQKIEIENYDDRRGQIEDTKAICSDILMHENDASKNRNGIGSKAKRGLIMTNRSDRNATSTDISVETGQISNENQTRYVSKGVLNEKSFLTLFRNMIKKKRKSKVEGGDGPEIKLTMNEDKTSFFIKVFVLGFENKNVFENSGETHKQRLRHNDGPSIAKTAKLNTAFEIIISKNDSKCNGVRVVHCLNFCGKGLNVDITNCWFMSNPRILAFISITIAESCIPETCKVKLANTILSTVHLHNTCSFSSIINWMLVKLGFIKSDSFEHTFTSAFASLILFDKLIKESYFELPFVRQLAFVIARPRTLTHKEEKARKEILRSCLNIEIKSFAFSCKYAFKIFVSVQLLLCNLEDGLKTAFESIDKLLVDYLHAENCLDFASDVLIYLGLLKSEFPVNVTNDVKTCLKLLMHIVKESYFPLNGVLIIDAFVRKPSKLLHAAEVEVNELEMILQKRIEKEMN